MVGLLAAEGKKYMSWPTGTEYESTALPIILARKLIQYVDVLVLVLLLPFRRFKLQYPTECSCLSGHSSFPRHCYPCQPPRSLNKYISSFPYYHTVLNKSLFVLIHCILFRNACIMKQYNIIWFNTDKNWTIITFNIIPLCNQGNIYMRSNCNI